MRDVSIDRLVAMSSDLANTRKAALEIDIRLARELEFASTSIMHSVRACIDQLYGLADIGVKDLATVEKQVDQLITAGLAEYTDKALELWDRYKSIWLLEACWNKEVV